MNDHNAHLPGLEPPHSWMNDAACRDTQVDPESFFYAGKTGHRERDVAQGLALCSTCPVISQCLAHAFDINDQFAVMGGTTPKQRRAMKGKEAA